MAEQLTRGEILEEACRVAATQAGGALATTHAEDGTPYVTFVLFHLRPNGEVLFGSVATAQHVRNIRATPETSFLIDNREVVRSDWEGFDRVVIEGLAEELSPAEANYDEFLRELAAKSSIASYFTQHGGLYRIVPRRLILMKGLEPARNIIDFHGT